MQKLALILLPFALLAGCASTSLEPKLGSRPVDGFDLVDPAKVEKEKYAQDYSACSALANQDVTELSRTAAAALNTAAERASMGILGGKSSKHADRMTVLKRCLSGRGYTVLR